jgi:heptose I phosphotransferase
VSLVLNAELARRWRDQDPFEVLDGIPGEVARRAPGRRTFRFELDGTAYYAKVHTGVGWGEILKNLLQFRAPVLGAGPEWRAALHLRYWGLGTVEPVAFGQRGRNPARLRSFVVTREIRDAVSLEPCLEAWAAGETVRAPSGAAFPPPGPRARFRLVEAVARTVRRLHDAGINHRDLYVCHLWLCAASTAEAPRLLLMDLHRAQLRDAVPERWRRKDLAALLYSVRDLRLTRAQRLRFVRAYAGTALRTALADPRDALGVDAGFWARVERRAEDLVRRHEGRDPDPGRAR